MYNQSAWNPSSLKHVYKISKSSMQTISGQTDAGDAYIKPLGGCRDGPHPLACELVGSKLARWFGLDVPDFAIFDLDELDIEIIQAHNGIAQKGPAFCSKKIPEAYPWDGNIAAIENTEAIPKIVVFDTWTLNWDRQPPKNDSLGRIANYDNLLITKAKESKKFKMWSIDFGECFSKSRTLSDKIAQIDRVKAEQIYGLFPGFQDFLTADLIAPSIQRLSEVETTEIKSMVASIPKEWDVDANARAALATLIIDRASFLTSNLRRMLHI